MKFALQASPFVRHRRQLYDPSTTTPGINTSNLAFHPRYSSNCRPDIQRRLNGQSGPKSLPAIESTSQRRVM